MEFSHFFPPREISRLLCEKNFEIFYECLFQYILNEKIRKNRGRGNEGGRKENARVCVNRVLPLHTYNSGISLHPVFPFLSARHCVLSDTSPRHVSIFTFLFFHFVMHPSCFSQLLAYTLFLFAPVLL